MYGSLISLQSLVVGLLNMYSGGYKNLLVWKKAISFASLIYEATKNFPPSELYGLTSRMRRSAVSIASNIAEGCARHSKKEFAQFLSIATGSLAEVITQAFIVKNIGVLSDVAPTRIEESGDAIGKMLNKLKASLSCIDKPYIVSSND